MNYHVFVFIFLFKVKNLELLATSQNIDLYHWLNSIKI